MCAESRDNTHDVWNQVLEAVAQKVGPHIFDTWFRAIGFTRCDGESCELTLPNKTFQQYFLERYSNVLQEAIAQVHGSERRIEISVPSCEGQNDGPSPFPILPASALESTADRKPWMIERLWSAGAVGFVSGPPKSLKTWTALEMAVSVASGTPCLGCFPVHHPGPVLLYAAEDPMPALRLRIESLARNHGLVIDKVDIRVITADSLRLDRPADRAKLLATVHLHRPALLILDPLVRLHSLDENQVGPMAELLGHVRSLQRTTGTAVAIVHHARKNAAHSAGQSLRGSSDLYAWLNVELNIQEIMFSLPLCAVLHKLSGTVRQQPRMSSHKFKGFPTRLSVRHLEYSFGAYR